MSRGSSRDRLIKTVKRHDERVHGFDKAKDLAAAKVLRRVEGGKWMSGIGALVPAMVGTNKDRGSISAKAKRLAGSRAGPLPETRGGGCPDGRGMGVCVYTGPYPPM